MSWFARTIRTLFVGFLGVLVFLCAFGLTLSILWLPEALGSVSRSYKVATLFLSGYGAISVAGLVVGSLSASHRVVRGAIFGLLIGLSSLTYILGPVTSVPFLSALSAAAGAAGGGVSQWRAHTRPPKSAAGHRSENLTDQPDQSVQA